MSTSTPSIVDTAVTVDTPGPSVVTTARAAKKKLTSPYASLLALVIAVLWTLPTFGLLVTSFRDQKDIRTSGWWNVVTNPSLTLDNYKEVLTGGETNLSQYFVNSLVITIPAVLLPILLASLAAYAFAWMRWPGRDAVFVAVFALQIVPLQVTLIPLLSLFVHLHTQNTFWSVWLAHTAFALPLAIFLMHNFMKEIPGELIEAARVDGAGHVRIFFQVLLPLIKPALAAFGIFQFLWVWNDLLVATIFLGSRPEVAPLTVRMAELSGSKGSAWYLLSAGAFVSIAVPLIVFLSLQRFFVRGLLAGGLKG